MKKVMIETEQGRSFTVHAKEVAKNRANYYLNKGESYQEEYDYTISDDSELIDWLLNNMDFYLCETVAEVTKKLDASELDVSDAHVFVK